MKHSLLRLTQAALCLIIILSLTAVTSGQTDCSVRWSGAGWTIGSVGERAQEYCTETPTNIVQQSGLTCVGCIFSDAGQLNKGGTANCTNFTQQMVILFPEPVADVEWTVYGARTVTDNRGYTVHLDPLMSPTGGPAGSAVARLPGGGITSLTISDPIVWDAYNPNGSLLAQGFWEIHSWSYSYTPGFIYSNCNCERPTITRPNSQGVFSPDWNGNGIPDWRMELEVSDDDGLVLKNIRLENRYMAEQISVPYYMLETSSVAGRGELKPDSGDPSMASRLVNFNSWSDDEKLVVEATYVVGKIPEGSANCLEIIQRYEFYKSKPGDQCEPSATLPCARWKPIVSYRFTGPAGDFHKLEIPQRHHFRDNGFEGNSVGLFRDCDYNPLLCLGLGGVIFTDKVNPLTYEYGSNVIAQGKDAGKWDNFHQTFLGSVDEPLVNPGCPECIHMHWRWGTHLGEAFGSGNPLIAAGSNQDVDIAAVAFHANPEDDPYNYRDLFQEPEATQTFATVPGGSTYNSKPRDMVLWYSSTGHLPKDTFSPTKGAFFNPSYQGMTATIAEGPPQGGVPDSSAAQKSSSALASLSSADQPESITFADLYEDGATTFSVVDPASLGALPNGYVVYNSDVYDVVSSATVSGPHVVTFSVPSVSDETTFNSLRILHVEPDSFDPEKSRFIDRTILSPELPAPDFDNRKLSAKVDGLGKFLLATYTAPPPNTDSADLAVTVSDAPDAVVASNNLTYTVAVTNNGPHTANEVMLKDSLAPEANFVSVNASQGTCREVEGSVLCSLDSLATSATATVTIVVTPNDGGTPFPPAGKVIRNVALVKAEVGDTNLANNSIIESTTVMPDPNTGPTISITSPITGTLLVGPTNVTVSATTNDPDGSVSGVDFYANGNLLGSGTLTGGDQYDFAWNNVPFGPQILTAVATDDLGKQRASDPVTIIVNGSAAVSITGPANWANFNKPANIPVTATASLSGGSISQVDFFRDGVLLGTGTFTIPNQYSLTWNAAPAGRHSLTAVATDNSGVTTTSTSVNLTVNDPPVISLLSPAPNSVFTTAPASVPIVANVSDWEGAVRKVDFYANGLLIGTKSLSGVNQFPFTWSNVPAGTYSITAVATDNYNALSTSTPVTVRVNAPPTLSITAPTNGTQFASPANITVTASASDPDGSVGQVSFFANGSNIGTGTAMGGNQFSLTWPNVPFGSYVISAVATDNDGKTTSANGPTVTVTTPVLFVTGSTTLNASDVAVKARLEALNHTVTVKDGASAIAADATGKAMVLISSTVTPTSVGTKFRTVTVPVITWESGLFNNMGMTGSTNKDFGTKTGQTQVSIINPSHPLAGGLTGTTTVVTSAKTFDWGKPNGNAIAIATASGDAAKTTIFAYEPGVAMPGLAAPARRLALFLYDDTAASFNVSGTALLDAAIKWARGGGSITGSMTSSPVGGINLTTQGTLDWAHWGRNGATSFDHKAGITQKITNVTKIGAGGLSWFTDCPTTFSWSDGTPTLNILNSATGINTNGSVGNGFEITVPSDTNLKTLKLYLGVWYTQGKLEATLSDGSAPAFIDTSLNRNGGSSFGLYTINFKAASSGQSLKIRFTILTQHFAPNGNVAWEAATLQ